MPNNTRHPEVQAALAELTLRRGMRFDATDAETWNTALAEYVDANGIIAEAVAQIVREPETYVTLALVESRLRTIGAERLARAKGADEFPPAPAGISGPDYVRWLSTANAIAMRGGRKKEIANGARAAIGLPPAAIEAPSRSSSSPALPRFTRSVTSQEQKK